MSNRVVLPAAAAVPDLPLICLQGAPPAFSWLRCRARRRRKMAKELQARYSCVCVAEPRGEGEQQAPASSSRDRGLRLTLPRPLTPNQGTEKEAFWEQRKGWLG